MMKMKKHVLSMVVFGLSLCLLSGVSWATGFGTFSVDVSFEVGDSPEDNGMNSINGAGEGAELTTPDGWETTLVFRGGGGRYAVDCSFRVFAQ